MQDASDIAQRQQVALESILSVLGRHDPEVIERIDHLFARGAMKWSPRSGVTTPQDEHLLILAEATATLARLVDELVEASKPRPRGRPPKNAKGDG